MHFNKARAEIEKIIKDKFIPFGRSACQDNVKRCASWHRFEHTHLNKTPRLLATFFPVFRLGVYSL